MALKKLEKDKGIIVRFVIGIRLGFLLDFPMIAFTEDDYLKAVYNFFNNFVQFKSCWHNG